MKKSICLIVVIFLLSLSFTPGIVANESSSGNTIYVDDDNTSGPWDGTQEHPYQFIQDGINASNDGDMVFVYSGTYYDCLPNSHECIKINKRINVIGENKKTTIIDGKGKNTVVYIGDPFNAVDGINLSGFTIKNSFYGIRVRYNKNTIIHNNLITDNYGGILVEQHTSDVLIKNNIITNNYNGIDTNPLATNINISNNIISNNEKGVFSSDGSISVYRNIISNNSIGVDLLWVFSDYDIIYNHIKDNGIGIMLFNSWMSLKNNNMINNFNQIYSIKAVTPLEILLLIGNRQIYNGNYWDDCIGSFPKLLIGVSLIHLIIELPTFEFPLLLGIIPDIQFDWFPAKEPYDIPE